MIFLTSWCKGEKNYFACTNRQILPTGLPALRQASLLKAWQAGVNHMICPAPQNKI
jgi:hypothetical protein